MDKKIYELALTDLISFPVWYFPMDETVEDEITVRPFNYLNDSENITQVIVRAKFHDVQGRCYPGFVYWGPSNVIEYNQPAMYFSNGDIFTFWFGMSNPQDKFLMQSLRKISELLPISYESEEIVGLSKVTGKLEGIYYMERGGILRMVAPLKGD